MEPGVSRLLAPFPLDDFLAKHWPQQPLVVHGAADRFVKLFETPQLRDFAALTEAWPFEAYVLPPGGGDEYSGAAVRGRAIRLLHDAGIPMFLHQPERLLPQLQDWLDCLRWELGIPAQTRLLCSTHATAGGTSTALHCDHAASFVAQLSGTKLWHIAPNDAFPLPTQRHSVRMSRVHPELAGYQQGPVPTDVPPDAQTVTLRPGSLLFLPSGWWHMVEGPDDSLALMFIAINVNWADVVTRALHRELIRDERWREFATGARSPRAPWQATARGHAAELLDDLRERLAETTAEALVAPRFVPSVSARCRFSDVALEIESRRWSTRLRMGSAELQIARSALTRTSSFRAADLEAEGYTRSRVDAVVAALVDAGALDVDP